MYQGNSDKYKRCYFNKNIFNDETFRHSIMYPNFRILCTTGAKQSLKDSSLHKDSKYIQFYIVPYKNLGVTGAEIRSCNLRHF